MNNEFLKALEANTSQSAARRVKRRLPDIEAALAQGFTHREIRAQLEREGIVLTEAYYARLIPRLRSQVRRLAAMPALAHPADGRAGAPDASAPSLPAQQVSATVGSQVPASKTDDLSPGLAMSAPDGPRTILPKAPEKKKFLWDPHGATNFDPDNF
jgi:hypothetical protein